MTDREYARYTSRSYMSTFKSAAAAISFSTSGHNLGKTKIIMLADGETAAGLFLRGDHDKKGVIPLLYQIYFLHHTEFRYFNFGEDLGIEGLRKNKLSFQPAELLELYDVTVK